MRWDGDHNGDVWPRRAVAALFDLAGLCPEVGVGMGVPRPPIRLVGDAASPRLVAVAQPGRDFAAEMRRYASDQAPLLNRVGGYIFADRSPSCGLSGVKVFNERGEWRRTGRGVHAAAVVAAYPDLPVVDAETLADEEQLLEFATAVIRHVAPAADNGSVRAMIARILEDAAQPQP